MISAVSEATVPKISVIVRKAYGAGLYAMAGPAFEPDCCIALPTASIAVMGPEAAINAVFYNQIQEIDDEAEREEFVQRKRDEYAADIDILHLASELVVDAVIEPDDLRAELIRRFEQSSSKDRRFSERRTRSPRRQSVGGTGSASPGGDYVDGLDVGDAMLIPRHGDPLHPAPPDRPRGEHAAARRRRLRPGARAQLGRRAASRARRRDVPLPGRLHRARRRRVRVRATGARHRVAGVRLRLAARASSTPGRERRARSCSTAASTGRPRAAVRDARPRSA